MVFTRDRIAVARGQRDKSLAVAQKVWSSKAPQFFKVVYGRDCSNVLYLPPKFVREVKPLAKQIHMEDFSGQQWPVMLHRYAGGSLAFQKGWHKFFVDHDLEEGYILLFTYIQKDHFVVKVFDRTACEKFDFNGMTPPQGEGPQRDLDIDSQEKPLQGTGGNMRDGLRSDSTIASDTVFQNTDRYQPVGNGSSFDRLQVNPTPMDIDLSCIINRDYGCEEFNRNWLCDLSKFEMVNINEHADGNKKATNANVVISEADTNESDTLMPAIDPNLVGSSGDLSMDRSSEYLDATIVIQHQKKGFDGQVAVEPADQITRLSSEIFYGKVENASDSKASSPSTEVTKEGGTKAAMPGIDPVNDHSRDALIGILHTEPPAWGNSCKDTIGDDHTQKSNMASSSVGKVEVTRRAGGIGYRVLKPSTSKTIKTRIKKELIELKQDTKAFPPHSCDAGLMQSPKKKHTQLLSPVVKTEPNLEWESDTSAGVICFTTEVKNYSCLELPFHIPSASGQKDKCQRKIVLLKDPSGRIWPLLYVNAFPLKVLAGNWKTFCEVNGIKVGNKCNFWSDNEKGMFQVEVVR